MFIKGSPGKKLAAIFILTLFTLWSQLPCCALFVKSSEKFPADKNVKNTYDSVTLSFDDGPHPVYTPKILDLLKKYNIKAVFCVQGKQCRKFPEILQRLKKEGHIIANHSYSHKNFQKITFEQAKQEILKTEAIVFKLTKTSTRLFRFPYGRSTPETVKFLKDRGYTVLNWDVDTRDWEYRRKKHVFKICACLERTVKKGGLLLMHDFMPYSLKALKRSLPVISKKYRDRISLGIYKTKNMYESEIESLYTEFKAVFSRIHSGFDKLNIKAAVESLRSVKPVPVPDYLLTWKPAEVIKKIINENLTEKTFSKQRLPEDLKYDLLLRCDTSLYIINEDPVNPDRKSNAVSKYRVSETWLNPAVVRKQSARVEDFDKKSKIKLLSKGLTAQLFLNNRDQKSLMTS